MLQTELLQPQSVPLAGQTKLTLQHRQKLACIYVRQSTLKQVEHNRESQDNQYQLVQKAEILGWPPERIHVIDADLGLSGKSSTHRNGFKELVAEVSMGHVGIIFGYEVSRLARNNSDWYQLLDLASVFGTLIADSDGIYDPRLYNDRLLLGLKGTMSEAELHLIRLRMEAGRMNQVRKGTYRQCLPTGLVRLPDSRVAFDPDDGVRHTIELVFNQFEQLGSCRQVVLALKKAEILLPRRQTGGFFRGQLLWKPVTEAAIYEILQNPAYAGAFVYGRRPGDPVRRQITGRAVQTRKELEEWVTIQQGVYPAYISWEQYLKIQERLHQNASTFTNLKIQAQAQGAIRTGSALLQGLLICGICGHHLGVSYKDKNQVRYVCNDRLKRVTSPACLSVAGPPVEKTVVKMFLEALRPSQLDALEEALSVQEKKHAEMLRHWQERVKRARYEVQLAERQYSAVDPVNRLVAGELERRWEKALVELQQTQEGYDRFVTATKPACVPEGLKEKFQHISERLPELWENGQLDNTQKKELLRTLIQKVIVRWICSETVEVRIVWISGHYTLVEVAMPIHRFKDLTRYNEFVERVQELLQKGKSRKEIALQLREEGFRSTRGELITESTVSKLIRQQGWQSAADLGKNAPSLPGYLTLRELALELNTDAIWLLAQIGNGRIAPEYIQKHPQRPRINLIKDDLCLKERLKQARLENEEYGQRRAQKRQQSATVKISEKPSMQLVK